MLILSPLSALPHPGNAPPAPSALQGNQCQSDVLFGDLKNQRLLMAVIILKADSQKVLALFREHEQTARSRPPPGTVDLLFGRTRSD